MYKSKAVILAGGYGSRLGRFTKLKPKPMVDVQGLPIILHIMNIYLKHSVNSFVICTGYKGEVIREFFLKKYKKYIIKRNKTELLIKKDEIEINIIDTGKNSLTGGRIKRIEKFVKDTDFFYMTYGDGLANIDIKKLTKFHLKHKKIATVTVVKLQVPQERFGVVYFKKKNIVKKFLEKPDIKEVYINGGFFVLTNKIFQYIKNDKTRWEAYPMQRIAKLKKLAAYRHNGFWKCMDTPRDRIYLEKFKKKLPWI
jgi:glucose-1-phosphate cytidylyltransferase|tara:strand:+ start:462 stop:1223 length:762 start_codon:yes stop_codon:yes gene_type:complete